MEKYLKEYLKHLKALNYVEKTIATHKRCVKRFLRYINDELNISDVAKVTREIALGFQQYLVAAESRYKKKLSITTQGMYLSCVKGFFKFLVLYDYILYDPTSIIELPRRGNRLPRGILTLEEMNSLLTLPDIATIQGYRDRVILELFYATAIRVSELINLNVYDIDIKNATVMIREGKCSKDRVVPLTETAAEFVEGYILTIRQKLLRNNYTDALMLWNNGSRLNKHQILRVIRRQAVKLNLKKKISCHTFRHSCASHLLAGGADIRYIQELLGHSSLESTQVYTRVEISDLKKIHKKYHPREKF